MSCLDVSACFASVSSYFSTMKIRHVGLAVVHCPKTRRVLLITSRKHPNLWISESSLQAHFIPKLDTDANSCIPQPCNILCRHDLTHVVPKGGVEKGETSGEAAAREAHEEGELTSFRQADNTAGIPAQIPEDDISPELCTIESAKPGVEVWHVHAIAIDSEKDLDKDW